jgi:ABC-type phosphate transport system substrate-binding protein
MPNLKIALAALGLAGLVLGLPDAGAQAPHPAGHPLLVVVNLKRPEADLTLHELSRLFRGEQRFWNNGDRAYPVLPPEDLPDARTGFLSSVVKLDQRGFTLHWRNLVFRGDVTDQPISPPDERRAVQSVFAERGAIAIVEGSAIRNLDRVAKILTVNGHVRDDADYPLKW